jgi:ectoine hydroxylase-related dioxygenase (phytanoyl-CoA dioxygenase family)
MIPQAGCPGVQVLTFLSPVGPGAGGTLVAAGSHRLLNDEGELTGAPGGLWLMDMRALHTAAPNASASPRLMMTWRFLREG